MKNKMLAGMLAVTSLGTASSVYAFNSGDVITFKPGVSSYGSGGPVVTGSYFAMDINGNGKFSAAERTAIAPGANGGIIIGALQPAAGSHAGCPNGSESNTIDAPWSGRRPSAMSMAIRRWTGPWPGFSISLADSALPWAITG